MTLSVRHLLCLPGDGIGPEIMRATLAVLDAMAPLLTRPITLEHAEIGFASLGVHGSTITDDVIARAKQADGVILGPVSHNEYPPVDEGGLNPSGVLRKALDLYANMRPAKSWPGLAPHNGKSIDVLVARENIEGFYADRNMYEGSGEFMPVPGVALAIRRITTEASRNIALAAFEAAQKRPVKKVTAIHKANVMRLSDGVFLDAVRMVAKSYPDVAYDEVLIDAAAALLVRDPNRFDVIVTTNMFGDILSDLASELSGSLGLAGSLNIGSKHVAAQAQHGSAPDIAGQDKANPTSLILSLAMLLDHLGEIKAASGITTAIATVLNDPSSCTMDVGGTMGTKEFTTELIACIKGKG